MPCDIIAPRQHEIVGDREDGYLAACILGRCHSGPHVVKTPEGEFFAWQDFWGCDCCGPDEVDRCFTYWEIKEADIPELAQGQM